MPINYDDPRIIKTRRGMREAFIRLIMKKGYDDISIQDIATEAQTARVTFYRHYHDKQELLTDCLNVLTEELRQRTEALTATDVLAGRSPSEAFYEHLEEQEELYLILFSSRGTQKVVQQLRHQLALRTLKILEESLEGEPPLPLEIIAHHIAGAQIGLGVWWLQNNKPYSKRYMAQVTMWLNLGGIARSTSIAELDLPVPQPDE